MVRVSQLFLQLVVGCHRQYTVYICTFLRWTEVVTSLEEAADWAYNLMVLRRLICKHIARPKIRLKLIMTSEVNGLFFHINKCRDGIFFSHLPLEEDQSRGSKVFQGHYPSQRTIWQPRNCTTPSRDRWPATAAREGEGLSAAPDRWLSSSLVHKLPKQKKGRWQYWVQFVSHN